MHRSNLSRLACNLLLAISLLIVPFVVQARAQGNTSSTTTSTQTTAPSTQSSQQQTTTSKRRLPPKQRAPRLRPRSTRSAIAVGAVACCHPGNRFLAMRGRSR